MCIFLLAVLGGQGAQVEGVPCSRRADAHGDGVSSGRVLEYRRDLPEVAVAHDCLGCVIVAVRLA
eukprot:9496132-Pyramimonas_sp.AAC.1